MSAPAFTPGPWEARPHDGGYLAVRRYSPGDGSLVTEFIAECRGKPNVPNESNARLIAAAPDLYEAVEGLLIAYKGAIPHPQYNVFYTGAIAALAKVRGEQ